MVNPFAFRNFWNTLIGMSKKKTPGRPPKNPDEKQSELITCKATAAERARYQALADAAGIKLSAWIRRTLNRAAR
jgi:hypothetical protein